MTDHKPVERHMGLWGATGIGVGAIVGGGILALAGVAFAATGPGAVLAFALNGIIAFMTALSFAEISARFPFSGGTYVFAKRVLSLEAAFIVGWVVWFASIAASALYAVGFASFARLLLDGVLTYALGERATAWNTSSLSMYLAVASIAIYTVILLRKSGAAGQWINVAKVSVFGVIILGGLIYARGQSFSAMTGQLRPFLAFGGMGLLQAMGFSFIALQGFDLISAVAGEVREPARNIPRAMFLSLGIALAIYLPLLLLVAVVGVPEGLSLTELGAESPAAMVAIAAENFMGPFGYWLVVVAGVLSMLSALHANLLAASHMARAMARDRSLPHALQRLGRRSRTPVPALLLTAGIVVAVVLCVSDVETAGAAASLIFLVTFALVHWICILLRQRSDTQSMPFRTPWYPAVPVLGGFSCLSLALYQGYVVRSAGLVAIVWMGIGTLLFLLVFARRARVVDASSAAIDPEVAQLRGRSPLVLVPIANPRNAHGLVSLANALAQPKVGRVLLLNVINPKAGETPSVRHGSLDNAQSMFRESLTAALDSGMRPDTLITLAEQPLREIARVARNHQCESLLLGLTSIDESASGSPLDTILGSADSDVVVLRARAGWHPDEAKRILIPLGGRGTHARLLARLLGSFFRTNYRDVTFLRVVRPNCGKRRLKSVRRHLEEIARDHGPGEAAVEVMAHADPVEAIVNRAAEHDLVILGVQRIRRSHKLMGPLVLQVARRSGTPMIVISGRG